MAKLLLPAAAPSTIEASQALTRVNNNAQRFEADALHEAVFQLPQGSSSTGKQYELAVLPTPEVVAAMQRLMDVINDLRSPASGWAEGGPQTSEALIPYVTEEAYDAFDVLQKQFIALQPEAIPATDAVPARQDYIVLNQLSSWLLWCIARSAFEVMQLLEGVVAKRSEAGQGWQDGILRLVAYFALETPDDTRLLDLTTYQAPENLLRLNDLIQSDECTLCQSSGLVSDLLQPLLQHIQATTPAISPFVTGMLVNTLIPHQNWRSSTLTLHLGLEFVATGNDCSPHSIEDIGLPSSATLDVVATPVGFSQPPLTKFTNEDWLNRYTALVIQQQLEAVIPQLPSVQAIAATREHAAVQLLIPQLVEDAYDLAEHLRESLTLASRTFPLRELRLNDLMLRLLWCFSRSTYEVMQLMSGIPVKLLLPKSNWQSGLLRLSVSLKLQTPEADWHLDLVTGQAPEPSPFPLVMSAIVQSEENQWCQKPTTVEELHTKLIQYTGRMSREIQLLLDGAEVDLLEADQQWQPGVIQLKANFEFVPSDFGYC